MKSLWTVVALMTVMLGLLGARQAQAALVVNGAGEVLMVDGGDKGHDVTVRIAAADLLRGYEFGYMDDGTFVPMIQPFKKMDRSHGIYSFDDGKLAPMVHAFKGLDHNNKFYTFSGGTSVNFALRSGSTGAIYTINDPANYATEIFSNPGDFFKKGHKLETTSDYRILTLDWNVNSNGFDSLSHSGPTISLIVLNPHDGMSPEAAPVKLLGSLIFFVTGLAGLAVWRKLASRSTTA
ncbi:MAG TPA: hypothetical protein VEI24_01765 [Nitrospiria bacterium]|nr:hypothetical protein [Nitrospiria bacterium]